MDGIVLFFKYIKFIERKEIINKSASAKAGGFSDIYSTEIIVSSGFKIKIAPKFGGDSHFYKTG
jgi:hypothetical protein